MERGGLFTGWVDVGLSARGATEASGGGTLLRESGVLPDLVHTSVLTRAIQTANLALEAAGLLWLPVRRSWRLNERHYGALQGKNKAQTREEFGEEQFMLWRRSYDVPPPPLADDDPYSQAGDPRYALLPPELMPRTECLQDVLNRLMPYWHDAIVPDLAADATVLVVAHGNSARPGEASTDGISDARSPGLNVPTGIPLVYEIGATSGLKNQVAVTSTADAAAAKAVAFRDADLSGWPAAWRLGADFLRRRFGAGRAGMSGLVPPEKSGMTPHWLRDKLGTGQRCGGRFALLRIPSGGAFDR
jgi:2,3-bisphosphoglycerate-dependent phosphoglycerate mutase